MITPTDGTLSPEEISLAKLHFDKFDVDNSGSIDIEELPSLLRHLGIQMEKERLDRYYYIFFGAGLDTMEPKLAWERFCVILGMLLRNQLPVSTIQIFRLRLVSQAQEADYIEFAKRGMQDADLIFSEFDRDCSGYLDQKELKNLFLCLGIGEGVDIDNFVADRMKELDKNNDDKVDFDEFVECYNSLMDLV